MNPLARLWPLRRPANPAAVREFRLKGRPEVHRVEAGTPLADARERGATVLFEADDLGRYVLGVASNDQGKPIAMICGWTTYSKGHIADVEGNVVEKRIAVAWGWKIEEEAKAEPEPPVGEPTGPSPRPRRTRAKGVPQAKRGG